LQELIRIVGLDFDNTTVDNEGTHKLITCRILMALEKDPSIADEIHRAWDEEMDILHFQMMREIGFALEREKFTRSMVNAFHRFKIEISRIEAEKLWETIVIPTKRNETKIFDDVLPFLSKVHNQYKLCMLSNGDMNYLNARLSHANLRSFFSWVFTPSVNFPYSKPDRAFFIECSKRMKCSADTILYIGDSLEFDVIPAIDCGMKAIFINRKLRREELYINGKLVNQVPSLIHAAELIYQNNRG
jgi:FMN phosphatase YigB (HAD superfamily)